MIHAGFRTDAGKKRRNNEDSYFILPGSNIYMVADGVGGHNSGELASRLAVGHIANELTGGRIPESEEEMKRYFSDIISKVNMEIWNESFLHSESKGMATTLVMAYIRKDKAFFINIGDSRAYIVRNGNIKQLTRDHTYTEELVREGSITREEARVHPDRNVITRALGGEIKVEADFYKVDIFEGDIIILCTDGLYGELEEDEILKFADRYENMTDLSRELTNEANRKGGNDNITVISLKI